MSFLKKSVLALMIGSPITSLYAAEVPVTINVPEKYKAESDQKSPKAKDDAIILEKANTIVLNDQVSEETVSLIIQEATEKSAKLPEGEPLYLFISSPGGEIVAGNHMISALQALGREVKTITSFSASMAFMTVQGLGERLITRDGVLMSHRPKGGFKGQFPGELETQLAFWKRYTGMLMEMAAKRIGISAEELQKKHYDEWWTAGQDSVNQRAADKVVNVRCGRTLIGKEDKDVSFFIWKFRVTFSTCPLVQAPLKIEQIKNDTDTKAKKDTKVKNISEEEANDYIQARFYDKTRFLYEYIMTGKYEDFLN